MKIEIQVVFSFMYRNMNIVIIADCHTNEEVNLLLYTLKSFCSLQDKFNPIIVGNFDYRVKEQMSTLAIVPYPRTTTMGYLKFLIQDRDFQDDEWIILMKSGDMMLEVPPNLLDPECDGYIGMQYLGVGKGYSILPEAETQNIETIHNFIKLHQDKILAEPGFSGSAIRAKYLKKYFDFYDSNESYLLQYIEKLSNAAFLVSPIVYRRPCVPKLNYEQNFIPNEFSSDNKDLTTLEKIELTDEIIRKSDKVMCWIGKLKETQNDMILAYKEKRNPNMIVRREILDGLMEEMNSIFEIVVDNDLF